jgi:hypothetical protein
MKHMMIHSIGRATGLLAMLLASGTLGLNAQTPGRISHHVAVRDVQGLLQPWTSWNDAIDREMQWYLKCPVEHGYPRFVTMTFMNGNYQPVTPDRPSFIPATQNGMGIVSYVKYYVHKGRKNPAVLDVARAMGNYLVRESRTPDTGRYPRFTRSTGWRDRFPQPADSGSQDDKPFEIEPDKGGIAGYALLLLHRETKDKAYLEQALQNARVLAGNMRAGDAQHSPWPFRVDYRSGEGRGEVSGNMSFILRLWDELIADGHTEFREPRAQLWSWIQQYQIPNLAKDGLLWVQFFEDHKELDNRTAWAPLNLARYLLEKQEALTPEWKTQARALIEFVDRRFMSVYDGVAVCGEQDYDRKPWGGVLSTYGAVVAMYAAAAGAPEYRLMARQALTYVLYATADDGCPGDGAFKTVRGGWQEDAHTDKIHNFMDALNAFPEWGK